MGALGRVKAGDVLANAGEGFPRIECLHAGGNLAGYVSGLDMFMVPPSNVKEHRGIAAVLSDYQVYYQTPGVGGGSSDVFRLQLTDQTADVLGAGLVTTSSTTVTGVGTTFLTTFSVGSYIRALGNTFKITAIASNTSMTIEAAPTAAWSAAAVAAAPGSFTATIGAGGTLPNATYYYKITAILAGGEGSLAVEASCTSASTNHTANLAWTAVSGAIGYRIYRGTVTNTEVFLAQVGAVTAYADDGSVTISATAISFGATYWKVPTISTIATITIAANTKIVAPVSLIVANKGVPLLPGQCIRLDSASVGTSYVTTPANIRVRLGLQSFGALG